MSFNAPVEGAFETISVLIGYFLKRAGTPPRSNP